MLFFSFVIRYFLVACTTSVFVWRWSNTKNEHFCYRLTTWKISSLHSTNKNGNLGVFSAISEKGHMLQDEISGKCTYFGLFIWKGLLFFFTYFTLNIFTFLGSKKPRCRLVDFCVLWCRQNLHSRLDLS